MMNGTDNLIINLSTSGLDNQSLNKNVTDLGPSHHNQVNKTEWVVLFFWERKGYLFKGGAD